MVPLDAVVEWTLSLDGSARHCLWMAPLYAVVGWLRLVLSLDGSAGRCRWMDAVVGWLHWTLSLDRHCS